MQLTKEGDYALRAVIYLASSDSRVCSASEISDSQGVPPKFLARIMPKLVKEGIVMSLPGSKGGYKLARPAYRVTFLEVLEAIEGPLHINVCIDKRFADCTHKETCSMKKVWKRAQDLMVQYFSDVTFDQLVEETPTQKLSAVS